MRSSIRTFIAVALGPRIQKAIEQTQNYIKKTGCDVKWVNPGNIHLTLKFLGEVKLKKIETIKHPLERLFRNTKLINTEPTQLGAFPDINRPRILWVGLKDEKQHIVQLNASLEEILGKIGFKKEHRLFNPHITIGRVRSPRNLTLLSQTMLNYSFPDGLTQIIHNVTLYQSTLTSQDPIYTALENFSLCDDRANEFL